MNPIVKTLIVTEDGLANGGFLQWTDLPASQAISDSREFHLGEFLRVLNETSWLGFDLQITKAHRSLPAATGLSEAALRADRGADVVGFRFDQPFVVNGETRTLSYFDMILFFAVKPSNFDIGRAAEVEAISQYMESGGGFFATGDHANLGGELCGLIPRVRSMRRWYYTGNLTADSPPGPGGELPAPPPLGPHRHDTTRPGTDGIGQFEDQSDEVPQEITPALYDAGLTARQGYVARKLLPHPLLCSPDGVVRFLPDHMHEGTCEVPDQLAGRTFQIGGAARREYPDYVPPNALPGFVPAPLAPELVATGQVIAGTVSPALDTDGHTGSSDGASGAVFGVIGAWDGHLVGKGRVVVDSTWHHFFNINLTGDRYLEDDGLGAQHQQKLHGFYVPDGAGGRKPADAYRMIMWYYRNIIYWLIPEGRTEEIGWRSLQHLTRRPQLSEELGTAVAISELKAFTFDRYLYFGQLAEKYLAAARGACATYLIHRILYKEKIPWWEWIQHVVDVWNPVELTSKAHEEVSTERLLGAWGVGVRPEVSATLGLGAAVVAAASAEQRGRSGPAPSTAIAAARKLFPSVLDHALGELERQLARGAETQRKLEKAITAQRRSNLADKPTTSY